MIAPVVAGMAVGIGVPILLAYVYGVVPISLCRSGGCGVSTSNSGVRFEFEEENDPNAAPSGPYAGKWLIYGLMGRTLGHTRVNVLCTGLSYTLKVGYTRESGLYTGKWAAHWYP